MPLLVASPLLTPAFPALAAPCLSFLPLPTCSCDKKLLELGWQETTTWEDGLKKTVDWYLTTAKREYW